LAPKKGKCGRKTGSVVTIDSESTIDSEALVTGLDVLIDPGSSEDEGAGVQMPDMDIMYESECILKQQTKKGEKREFLVRWVEKEARDTWTKEADLSDALLLHWWTTHTRTATKRKGLKISLISAPCAWAYRRVWEEGSYELSKYIDYNRNAL